MRRGFLVILIAFLPLLAALSIFAQNHIAAFKFVTDPQAVALGELSSALTIQAQDPMGNSATTTETTDLEFSSSSMTGEFLNASGNPVSTVMNKGTANRTFYYRDQSSGSHTLDVKAIGRVSGKSWTASQMISVGGGGQQNQGAEPSVPSVNTQTTVVVPPSPQIGAYAGEDREAAVGSLVSFLGQATGLEGKPLEHARFWWNFGDGATKEGRSVAHAYQFPGKYTVGLHVSSGGYAVSDYLSVTVVPNRLAVSGVLPGEDGFIRLKNDSDADIDIDGWSMEDSGGAIFRVPPRTRIEEKSEVTLANAVTGLLKDSRAIYLVMHYPDGKEAFRWASDEKDGYAASPPTANVQADVKHPVFNIPREESAASNIQDTSEVAAVAQSARPSTLFFMLAAALSLAAAAGFLILKWKGLK